MIDSRTAAHTAVFTALDADAGLAAVADVWGHAEEDTQPTDKALVFVAVARAENIGGKDGGLDEVTLIVMIESRKPDITELYAVSTLVRNLLEGQSISTPGATIGAPEFLSADPSLDEDGETYSDTLQFRMIVQG